MDFDRLLDGLTRVCVNTFQSGDGKTPGFLYESSTGSQTVSAVFDHNYQLVTLIDGAEISTFRPVVKVHAKDFPAPIEPGDKFTQIATGKVFTVEDVQPDSGFALVVILHTEE